MIEFVLQDKDGAQSVLHYDPAVHALFEDGVRLTVSRQDRPGEQSLRKVVRLSLGKACNFSCAYCCQAATKNDVECTGDPSVLVERIVRYVGEDGIGQVQFWGGEPLLYFETVRELHKRFLKHCPGLRHFRPERPPFFFSTNGSLLFGERLDWILENKIQVSLSWDGPGQGLRGPDILEDRRVLDAVRALHRQDHPIFFAPVLTRASPSHRAVVDALAGVLGSRRFILSESKLAVVHDEASLASAVPEEELPAFSRMLHRDLVSGDLPQFQGAPHLAGLFLNALESWTPPPAKCFVGGSDTLTMDMIGNILVCQNFNADSTDECGESLRLGHVSRPEAVRQPELRRLRARQESRCVRCPVHVLCRGGCPYTPRKYEDYNCTANYHQYLPVVGLALYQLTEKLLQEVGHDTSPIPINTEKRHA